MKTQKERFAEELKKISTEITAKDRDYILKKANITRNTLFLYLNGDVRSNDTAYDILFYAKECIEKRNKILA